MRNWLSTATDPAHQSEHKELEMECPNCHEDLGFDDCFDRIEIFRCPNCDALYENGQFVCIGVPKTQRTN